MPRQKRRIPSNGTPRRSARAVPGLGSNIVLRRNVDTTARRSTSMSRLTSTEYTKSKRS